MHIVNVKRYIIPFNFGLLYKIKNNNYVIIDTRVLKFK